MHSHFRSRKWEDLTVQARSNPCPLWSTFAGVLGRSVDLRPCGRLSGFLKANVRALKFYGETLRTPILVGVTIQICLPVSICQVRVTGRPMTGIAADISSKCRPAKLARCQEDNLYQYTGSNNYSYSQYINLQSQSTSTRIWIPLLFLVCPYSAPCLRIAH